MESLKRQNDMLEERVGNLKRGNDLKLEQKDKEIEDLKKQLEESQVLANKYMEAFSKCFQKRVRI